MCRMQLFKHSDRRCLYRHRSYHLFHVIKKYQNNDRKDDSCQIDATRCKSRFLPVYYFNGRAFSLEEVNCRPELPYTDHGAMKLSRMTWKRRMCRKSYHEGLHARLKHEQFVGRSQLCFCIFCHGHWPWACLESVPFSHTLHFSRHHILSPAH